jgi:hypothetical protein
VRSAAAWRVAAPATFGALALATAFGAAALGASSKATWRPYVKLPAVLDIVGPRSDGRLVVAAGAGLRTLGRHGGLRPFATEPHGYTASPAGEPYIALAERGEVAGADCSFQRGDVYALRTRSSPGVVRVSRRGHASRLVDLPAGSNPTGIAFDRGGRFGHRLLLTVAAPKGGANVYAVDCAGGLERLTSEASRMEGGIAVAPAGFGAFGGDLIAADEGSGRVFAVGPGGGVHRIARPPLPAGGDTGVESVGFVPARARGHAYVADRRVPGNPHPGTGSILRLSLARLDARGVGGGDLLVVTEGGARTIRIRCARRCSTREVATGPALAHVEGHIAFGS